MFRKLLAFSIVSFLYFYDATTFPPIKFPELRFNVSASTPVLLVSPLPRDSKIVADLNNDGVINSLDWTKGLKRSD